MNAKSNRLAPNDAITALVELSREEASHVRERSRKQQQEIARLGSELMELINAAPDTIPADECSGYGHNIESKHRELFIVIRELFVPQLIAGAPSQPSKVASIEEKLIPLMSLGEPYILRYTAWLEEQQAEEERQSRAKAYIEDETFEEALRARLRSGEAVNVEYERRIRQQQKDTPK